MVTKRKIAGRLPLYYEPVPQVYELGDNRRVVVGGSRHYTLATREEVKESAVDFPLLEITAAATGETIIMWGSGSRQLLSIEQENIELRVENYALREKIQAIEERLANIEAAIPKERVIILQEISKEAAKEEIRNLFSTGRTLYYSDIAEKLRLDLEMVVEICNELQESGEISIDAGVS